MIIGSKFSDKHKNYLKIVLELSNKNPAYKIPVKEINHQLELDRTELKNVLEYLEDLGLLTIATIGGPFLYGHVQITEEGIKKASGF